MVYLTSTILYSSRVFDVSGDCCPQGLFDNLEQLNVSQIRHLYSILCVLAHGYGNEDEEEGGYGIQDELHAIIRKQLFHVEQRWVELGVRVHVAMHGEGVICE